ncbi:MAG: GAF domain-containing protein [Symploca sp. SIO2E6]|nr:GAF domain-containing protein [Symploca sp. SIO2E6]
MSITTSVLADLLQAMPQLRQQVYFKASLTALSHAMEDQILAGSEQPLVIASFQREHFYRTEANRYRRIAERTSQVYVLATPEAEFKNSSEYYETVAFERADALTQEWHLVVIGQNYANCLVSREKSMGVPKFVNQEIDSSRHFEGIWTFDRDVCNYAAELLLDRIEVYRPELAAKIAEAKVQYLGNSSAVSTRLKQNSANSDAFVQRLATYLQAGQYKLLKAYRSLSAQEQKERLVNSITDAIRRSLDPEEILEIAVQELGQSLGACRCVIYRCKATDVTAIISHEFIRKRGKGEKSLVPTRGQVWPLRDNCLFQEVAKHLEPIYVEDTRKDPRINPTKELANSSNRVSQEDDKETSETLKNLVQKLSIRSWLKVPVIYQEQLLGMLDLHHCRSKPYHWEEDELAMVKAIATQIGVALIQAEAYANLEDLNQQLAALERTRSNLVAITGHELRTPLSTIQVCLESMATEPDMSPDLRQVMLDTALADSERMRKLVQDFLTLSRLESGRVEWNLEPLSIKECIYLAMSHIRAHRSEDERPEITAKVADNLPLVQADGEWLVEALAKLLDNACKFTNPQGQVSIETQGRDDSILEVIVSDTGRGIEPNRLNDIFERFYQEEGALRRTTGGTGLGLAICRLIVKGWGGEIWANSAGKDQGSQFHFTVPMINALPEAKPSAAKGKIVARDKKAARQQGSKAARLQGSPDEKNFTTRG